jgi:hypothetical protein
MGSAQLVSLLDLEFYTLYCSPGSAHIDARYPGIITIEYPLHPLFGRQFNVARRFRWGGALIFGIDLGNGMRASIPEWMTRRDECAQLRCGVDPVCCLSALREVLALVDQRDL